MWTNQTTSSIEARLNWIRHGWGTKQFPSSFDCRESWTGHYNKSGAMNIKTWTRWLVKRPISFKAFRFNSTKSALPIKTQKWIEKTKIIRTKKKAQSHEGSLLSNIKQKDKRIGSIRMNKEMKRGRWKGKKQLEYGKANKGTKRTLESANEKTSRVKSNKRKKTPR